MSEPGGHRARARRSRRIAPGGGPLVCLAATLLVAGCAVMPSAGSTVPSSVAVEVLLDEHFEGGRLDPAVWNTCHWWDDGGCTITTNDELEWYLPGQVAVRDGALRLTAARRPVEGSDGRRYAYRSGMVTTGPATYQGRPKLAWTYGSVEARLRVPAGRGLWPALWLLPATSEARPEIDVLEVLGHDPATVTMHLHPEAPGARSPAAEHTLAEGSFADGWHTVRLDWDPGLLVWSVDGREVWRVTGDAVPDEPMYLVANLAVGGNYPGAPDATTAFPAVYAVDHVRVTGSS